MSSYSPDGGDVTIGVVYRLRVTVLLGRRVPFLLLVPAPSIDATVAPRKTNKSALPLLKVLKRQLYPAQSGAKMPVEN